MVNTLLCQSTQLCELRNKLLLLLTTTIGYKLFVEIANSRATKSLLDSRFKPLIDSSLKYRIKTETLLLPKKKKEKEKGKEWAYQHRVHY